MRPRKRVLLYCADPDRRNDLAFVLRIRCLWAFVETFDALTDLVVDTERREAGCVVLVNGMREDLGEQFDVDWALSRSEIAMRSIEVRDAADLVRPSLAGLAVAAGNIAELVEAMRIAAARKRGPKLKQPARKAA